ncbi:MAG TPA: rod shape-determining protein MreD [Bacillota bacterium]
MARLPWASLLLVLLAALVQVTIVPLVIPGAARPDGVLVLATLAGFLGGPRYGLFMGMAGGLLLDVVTGRFLGLHLLIKGLAGAAGGRLTRHVYREHAPVALLMVALATVGQELLHALCFRVFGIVIPISRVFALLPTIISANLVLAGLLYLPLYRLAGVVPDAGPRPAPGRWPVKGGGRL